MPSAGKATGKIQRPGPDAPGGPRVKRVCEVCEHEFWPRVVDVQRGWGKHCSSNCSSKALRRTTTFKCAGCGMVGLSKDSRKKWHPECWQKKIEEGRRRACEECGGEFLKKRDGSDRFCSHGCAAKSSVARAMIGGVEFTVDEIAEARGVSRETVRSQLQRIRREGRPDDDILVVRRGGGRKNHFGSRGRVLELNGETLNQTQWAKRIGISQVALSRRLRTMSVEEALTKPPTRKTKTPTASQR